ncbi:MAG TPA: DUF3575 domain-containing protein, partial [Gemmatimonadaceae bacterium]
MWIRPITRQALLLAATALGVLAAPAGSLAAQEVPARDNLLSTNPITLVFGWFTGEYERRIGAGTSIAIGGSYFELEDDNDGDESYATADVKLRYYPNERVFEGFSLGASVGYASVEEVADIFTAETRRVSGPTVGLGVDYGWLIGKRDNVHIDLGVGARRAFYG